MHATRWAAAVALGAAGALALAAGAQAHHNVPAITVGEPGDCGETTISTAWTADTHTVDNTVLVVQAGGEQYTAAVGEAVQVPAAQVETAEIRWRVWGGGERDYDQPALDDLDLLLEHLDAGGSPLDADAPGVAWHELAVDGCPPPPATEEPTPPATEEPTAEPTEPAAPGKGGELPVTGAALPLLVGSGVALLGGGGAAVLLGRRRRIG